MTNCDTDKCFYSLVSRQVIYKKTKQRGINREMELILPLLTIFLLFFALSGRCSDKNDFPEGFIFGSATSAYQVLRNLIFQLLGLCLSFF